jgi:integrase
MVRQIARLNALAVSKAKKSGMYADGAGLYLQVSAAGTKSWIFRYAMNGREREMGLGPFPDVSLAEAREKAHQCRNQKRDGTDPIEARKSARQQAQLEVAKATTFKDAAEAYIKSHGPSWRNDKHGDQWRNTLAAYVYPVFGTVAVGDVDVGLVMKVIEPIWATKTETASRLRGRIEKVLDWATARGYRQGENPARWRGHLENLLPKRSKVRNVNHHPALPFAEIGAFMKSLRAQDGTAARALEFLILTAARTKEVIGATWTEIDLDEGVWSVPAHRMKANRAHRVPLAPAALAILEKMKKAQINDYVFPGRGKKPMSNMAMLALLKRMERPDLTAHGFRSTFRDWVAEKTDYPGELAEMALAHTVSNKVEAAYRRGDQFDKRRKLMKEWADFCG